MSLDKKQQQFFHNVSGSCVAEHILRVVWCSQDGSQVLLLGHQSSGKDVELLGAPGRILQPQILEWRLIILHARAIGCPVPPFPAHVARKL
jgi:hypothetical protein